MNPYCIRHLVSAGAIALLLAACGGGGGEPAAPLGAGAPAAAQMIQISGMAATGSAIGNAMVSAVNARGERAGATTSSSGSFTLSVADAAPYMLAVTDAAGKVWYSYAQAAGNANLTPLTTLALLQANGNKPLADLMAAWNTRQLSAEQVLAAAKVVNANFATMMRGKGVDPAATNIFTQVFNANGTGLDAVLDALRLTVNCSASACSHSITGPAGSAIVNWDAAIATGGIALSWAAGAGGSIDIGLGSCRAPKAGTYSLVVQTSVSGIGAVSIPELCIDGLADKPTTQASFCASTSVTQHLPPGVLTLSCIYDGTSGTIAARVTLPFVVDYSVKYTFVKH